MFPAGEHDPPSEREDHQRTDRSREVRRKPRHAELSENGRIARKNGGQQSVGQPRHVTTSWERPTLAALRTGLFHVSRFLLCLGARRLVVDM
jgi:hypothetical protein